MINGSDLQIVFGHPEGFFHLPRPMIPGQNVGTVHLRQIGDDTVQTIPLTGQLHFIGINEKFALILDLKILIVTVIVQQVLLVLLLPGFLMSLSSVFTRSCLSLSTRTEN